MNKIIRRAISMLLAMLLTAACCSVATSAATVENVYQYGKEGGYLAIGDSISRGCGSDGFYLDQDKASGGQYDLFYMRNVQGCVPYQIAQAVGCTAPDDITDQNATYWPFTYPGMTTAVTLDLLGVEDNFKDEKLRYAYYKDMLQYFGYEGSFDGVRDGDYYVEGECGQCGNIIELIQKADLITLQLGMCDIFYRAYRIISNGGMLKDGLKLDLSSTDAIRALLKTAISEMKFGYDYWKEYYPVLLEKIIELNPDATIVMVGSFNVVNQLTITDDTIMPVGSVVSGITDSMNKMYRKWAKKYNVLYADISSTETLAAENDWSIMGEFKNNSLVATHPSQTGYNYIARQILAQLPDKEEHKNIVVDLGRFNKVDKVRINGINVKNYTLNGYELSIPYSGPATNLTIQINNDDGTIAIQRYRLTYRVGSGYTAQRVYGTNDLESLFMKPRNAFVKLLYALLSKLEGSIR